jgi:hypothetical protein
MFASEILFDYIRVRRQPQPLRELGIKIPRGGRSFSAGIDTRRITPNATKEGKNSPIALKFPASVAPSLEVPAASAAAAYRDQVRRHRLPQLF